MLVGGGGGGGGERGGGGNLYQNKQIFMCFTIIRTTKKNLISNFFCTMLSKKTYGDFLPTSQYEADSTAKMRPFLISKYCQCHVGY